MTQSSRLKQLHQIISALEKFQTRRNSLFSLNKLAQYLNLSKRELKEMFTLVFRFQALFESVFGDNILVKKWKNEKEYLILKPKSEVKNIGVTGLKEIEIDREQVKLLNDIAYYFLHVKIGKGFDVKRNKTELSKKVSQLKLTHPFFFERRGNGLVYPSKLAVDVGNLIRSYNKSKKSLTKLEIDDYLIQIV